MISMKHLPRTEEKHTLYIPSPHAQILAYLLEKNGIKYDGEGYVDLLFKPETIDDQKYWYNKYIEKVPNVTVSLSNMRTIVTNIDENILFDFITNIPITGDNVDPDVQAFIDAVLTVRPYSNHS